MPAVTRSSENYTAADKLDATAEKVDALADEWDIAKKMAEERHQAIQAQLAELTRLITASQNHHSRPPPHDLGETSHHHQVHDSHLEHNRHSDSVENNGFKQTFGNRESMLKKVDMPIFEGVDAYAWFNLVERFFELGKYNDAEKLELVSVSLAGRALRWYKWEVRHIPFANWVRFKEKVLMRFGSFTTSDSAQEQESSIQEGLSSERPLILEEELETKRTIEAQWILDTGLIKDKESGEATYSILRTDLLCQTKLPHLQVPITSWDSSTQGDLLGDYRMNLKAVPRTHVVENIENTIVDDFHDIVWKSREELSNVQEVAEEFQYMYNSEIKSYAHQLLDKGILREQHQKKMKCSKSWRFKFKTELEIGVNHVTRVIHEHRELQHTLFWIQQAKNLWREQKCKTLRAVSKYIMWKTGNTEVVVSDPSVWGQVETQGGRKGNHGEVEIGKSMQQEDKKEFHVGKQLYLVVIKGRKQLKSRRQRKFTKNWNFKYKERKKQRYLWPSKRAKLFSEWDEFVVEPMDIMDTRYNDQGDLEGLVLWKGLPAHEQTWVLIRDLVPQFPTFELGDKLSCAAGVLISHGECLREEERRELTCHEGSCGR